MLTIRTTQMDSLSKGLYEKELTRYSRARFPGRFDDWTPARMHTFCAEVSSIATQLGIINGSDLATLLDLIVMYGKDFPEAEWAKDVFLVKEWSGLEKIQVLRSRVQKWMPNF